MHISSIKPDFKLKYLLFRPTKGGHAFDFRISYKVLPRDNAIVRFGGVQENINNETRGSSSYYNKNIFKDNEPNEGMSFIGTEMK